MKLKESMHQDFELLKIPSDICISAAPFFLCWLPGIHIRKKKRSTEFKIAWLTVPLK